MLSLTLIIVALFVLLMAAITDLKAFEVPDWLNYAGIAAGIGIHLIFSLQQWNYWPISSSLIGFGIGFALACTMYYTGQWGGGDAKLLMALGALIGFEPSKLAFGTSFLINLAFVGGAWGLLWTSALAIKNAKTFLKKFKETRNENKYKKLRIMTLFTTGILLTASFIITNFRFELISLALIGYVLCYLTIFIKSTELSSMHKWVTPDKLTEGDWLVEPVKYGKEKLMPPKLGLEKEHLALLQKLYAQKKIDKVLVKYGVPFAPAFLIAFIATLLFNNIIFTIITQV
ncbi:Preflagellin peptidase [uncultured archaeon]|nr:Preflagellin peptidase [uncultured archaeon]